MTVAQGDRRKDVACVLGAGFALAVTALAALAMVASSRHGPAIAHPVPAPCADRNGAPAPSRLGRLSGSAVGAPAIIGLAFCSDGSAILASAETESVLVDIASGKVTRRYCTMGPGAHRYGVISASVSRDGSQFLTGSRDGTAILWSTRTGVVSRRLDMRYANMTSVNGVSFSGDGSRVATCADDQGTVAAVWEVATGNRTATLSYSACKRAYPNRAVFSRSGDEALVATAEGAIVVWRISTGNVRILRGHLPSAGVSCVAASPVDDHAADVAQDGRAILWNLARGVMVVEFEGRVFGASDLAFSPDGRRLVAAGLFRLNGDQVMRGGNGTIVWDTTSGKKSLVLDAPSCSVAFSADGKLIATGWNDGTVALYDSKSGRLVRTVLGNNQ